MTKIGFNKKLKFESRQNSYSWIAFKLFYFCMLIEKDDTAPKEHFTESKFEYFLCNILLQILFPFSFLFCIEHTFCNAFFNHKSLVKHITQQLGLCASVLHLLD